MSPSHTTGKLLVATPQIEEGVFHRSVVLVLHHGDDGAQGLVLNRPAETLVAEAVPDLSELADSGAPLYVGGPVAADSVIVLAEFDEPWLAGVLLDDDLGFVGGGGDDLAEVADGVRRARVFAGHSGWGPGQLAQEMARGSWLHTNADPKLVFETPPEDMWDAAIRALGVNPADLFASRGVN